jgi:RimJ/RimL family protein N-acetyltransferase
MYFIDQTLFTKESHLKWMKEYVATGKTHQFIIIEKGNNISIGSVYVRNVDMIHKKAEFGIFIGKEKYRGSGFGIEATKLILRYAFEELSLNKVFLRVLSNNYAAIRSYLKAGFKYEGYFREDICVNSEYLDVIFMGILRDEEKYELNHEKKNSFNKLLLINMEEDE